MSGEWATVMSAGPSPTAGRPFLTADNRVVIELAQVTPANVDNTGPYIVWTDITDRVIEATWSEGSTNGQESRWSIGSCTIDCYDLVDEVADFITDDPATRLAPGSLLRVSMVDPVTPVWFPQFSGIIDSITEADTPGPRWWRITAFDVLYQAAGDTGLTHWASIAAGTALDAALASTFGYIPVWRFAIDGHPSTPILSCAFDIAGNLLSLAHRIADSYGCRMWGYVDGTVRVRPWDHIDNGSGSAPMLVDYHDPGEADEVYAIPSWAASTARSAAVLAIESPDDPSPALATTDFDLQAKVGNRQDAPGWPKLDALYTGAFTGSTLAGAAAARYGNELSLDRLDIDTQRNKHTDADVDLLRSWGAGDGILFRRAAGTPLDCELLILGAQHRINRENGRERWQCSYSPKILTYGPPP